MESNINVIFSENGDKMFATSGDINLDFFVRITRGADPKDYLEVFRNAWNENQKLAIQNLASLRDPRNGKGEKLISIVLMLMLKIYLKDDIFYQELLEYIFIRNGCWKDLLKLMELSYYYDNLHNDVEINLFRNTLRDDLTKLYESSTTDTNPVAISLCAKWAPTEGSHFDKHPLRFAHMIAAAQNINMHAYRLNISKMRKHLNVLEMLMSTNRYNEIDFSKVPAVAMLKNKKAFNRNKNAKGKESDERTELCKSYKDYLQKLATGKTKVNVKGIQPHELVNHYLHGDPVVDQMVESQWNTIVDGIKKNGSFTNVTAVVDVSGSMSGQPMEVAIALGILVASCTSHPFNNRVITFHESPSWYQIAGKTLMDKVNILQNAPWGGNTDIRKVFQLILSDAKFYQLQPEQMVKTLFIFTDMQFDSASNVGADQETAFDTMRREYNEAGYDLPKIICWNLRTSTTKSLPSLKDENGVAMLSGFSGELLKSIMNNETFSPISMMRQILEVYEISEILQKTQKLEQCVDYEKLNEAIKKSTIKKSFKKQK